MRHLSKRIFLLALSALMALSFSLALPMVALADGEVTITGEDTVAIQADGTKGTLQLSAACAATHDPAGTISWTSGNTAAATVSDAGLVTAVAAGEAVITATCSGDHDDQTDGVQTASATKTVTVTQQTQQVTITLDKTPSFSGLNQEETVTATVTPNVAGTWQWTAGTGLGLAIGTDDNVATVTSNAGGVSSLSVTFTPTNTNYLPDTETIQITIVDDTPALTLTASATKFTSTGAAGTVAASITNPGTGVWAYAASVTKGSAVAIESIGSEGTVSFKTKAEGTSTITVQAKKGDVTLTKTVDITVDLPDPYLRLTTDHDTLSLDRTKTKVKAKLYNYNTDVPKDSRIYWSTSNSSVAKVTAGSKYMDDAEASATVYARGNGKAIITARTNDGHVVDTIEIVVKNYKSIPQTGQNTTLIALEIAALGAILICAGVVYARRRNQKEG